jgi:MFS family permease
VCIGANHGGARRASYSPTLLGRSHHLACAHASVLDGSIANVALPTIAADLNAPAADSVWVVNAYQLAIVVSLLPMAAIGEIVGFRRVFQLGIIVFSLGSLGCTFAHFLPMLAFARAIQGFGAAGIMSQNGALVRFTYPSKMLGRGLGLNALVAAAGAALGPRWRPVSSQWHPGSGCLRSTFRSGSAPICWEENLFRTTRNPARSISASEGTSMLQPSSRSPECDHYRGRLVSRISSVARSFPSG